MTGPEFILRTRMREPQSPIAFVGSGLSSNHSFWPQFAQKLVAYVDKKDIEAAIRDDPELLKDADMLAYIMDECIAQFVKQGRDLAEFMHVEFCATKKPIPPVFDAIVRAPFSFLLTTNYDTNIEDSYKKNFGRELPVVLPHRPEEALEHIRKRRSFVFKIHGCARLKRDFVVSQEQYQAVIFKRDVQAVLQTIFMSYVTVFMGYGHRDPHISNYLTLQNQVLQFGGPEHFTYVLNSGGEFRRAHYRNKFGLHSIVIDDWDDIERHLSELVFLQVRDQYERIRRENEVAFRDFLDLNVQSAWGAILYAFAASDLGRSDEIRELRYVIDRNAGLRDAIRSQPSLDLAYSVVCGVMFLRAEDPSSAANEFRKVVELVEKHDSLSPPLAALALRACVRRPLFADNG